MLTMYEHQKLSRIFREAECIPFDDLSKIAIMSDCHRGDGSWADSFSKNKNIYYAALNYYYDMNYTYIELGDGDELWENYELSEIVNQHSDVFFLLSKFIDSGRAYFIYGNHDIVKKFSGFAKCSKYRFMDKREKANISLFDKVKFHEGLILEHTLFGKRIFLVHGHQVSLMNDRLWRLSRFLVRYVWRPLELLGVNDPISAAKNYKKKASVESKLIDWVKKEKHILIAGHTHRPMFPELGDWPYFNDGSCIHPYGITSIEIADGNISLVRWSIKTKKDGTLFVDREIIAGPEKLINYFKYLENKKYNNV
ncbi:hypothetical protein Clocl_0961 [Acetivibrio clariflavus DSM 19732]|uniref:Calcineurin-like phosphoesterase domain-containing protein n=2 Tax=Acetivibrio clariflavus TaxID=288965 RepID=G8LWY7_ACECE|nr:hypothetical protein Clocl_0961 [Acetivibrio clariflavus DSM 19732]